MSAEGPQGEISVSSMIKEIQGLRDKLKTDENETFSPFHGLEKAAVLQDCRVFNDANEVRQRPHYCSELITKLLHILTQGESFSGPEMTEVFFGVTKLFQSPDPNLRRMIYLFIKEVAEATAADEVIIVTQSLTKDMTSNEADLYRANAIRVLSKIVDGGMLMAIERFIKQAIVDRNDLVSSSALVSGIHLVSQHPDVVRRWVNEVSEAVNKGNEMVQYHALALLYEIKQHDRQAVSKLVTQLSRTTQQSPLATCLLIRYTSKLLQEETPAINAQVAFQFLESCMRQRSSNETVVFEAARAICNLPNAVERDLTSAVPVLHLFLSSSKPTLKFAALRTLNKVAMKFPEAVSRCNEDMELLITDPNRSVATLAITTLLKTGNASGVDRLMKQILQFMGEIADEFKVVVVDAIRALCLKYPQKHPVMFNFLACILRDEGGYELKRKVTDSFVALMDALPDTREFGLLHLCEFIEDCEFTSLCTRILHLLGEQGPEAASPARFIRYIYNRVILENATVRAAAVSALAAIGTRVDYLRENVLTLLERCYHDEDDEVRDRAILYVKLLRSDDEQTRRLALDPMPMSEAQLELSTKMYLMRPAAGPISLDVLPHVEEPRAAPVAAPEETASGEQSAAPSDSNAGAAAAAAAAAQDAQADAAAALFKIPEFADYGALFRSVPAVQLTESETEYRVACVKHVFPRHVVFQFDVTLDMDGFVLTDVAVELLAGARGCPLRQVASVPAARVVPFEPAPTYVAFALDDATVLPVEELAFEPTLTFNLCEVEVGSLEPLDAGAPDSYPLERLRLKTADFVSRAPPTPGGWDDVGNEVREMFSLNRPSVRECAASLIAAIGLLPDKGLPDAAATKVGYILSGIAVGHVRAMARAQFVAQDGGVTLKFAVRAETPEVAQALFQAWCGVAS